MADKMQTQIKCDQCGEMGHTQDSHMEKGEASKSTSQYGGTSKFMSKESDWQGK